MAAVRADLIDARRRLYGAQQRIDALLRLDEADSEGMAEAAAPLIAAAKVLPE